MPNRLLLSHSGIGRVGIGDNRRIMQVEKDRGQSFTHVVENYIAKAKPCRLQCNNTGLLQSKTAEPLRARLFVNLLFRLSINNPCRPCRRLEALEEFFPFQESP